MKTLGKETLLFVLPCGFDTHYIWQVSSFLGKLYVHPGKLKGSD